MQKSKQATKVRVKAPQRPKVGSRPAVRTLLLEILFFFALAVFGFSAVSYWLGSRAGIVVQLVPGLLAPDSAQAALLYEAPSQRELPTPSVSPIFMPSVLYWQDSILEWADEYTLDPNLIATIMQIESCGDPRAGSGAGAVGLFQVMPFHFVEGEDPYDPDTNALRGLSFLSAGLELSGGHAGLALAGYNGGHTRIAQSYEDWPRETQRYYRWGSGIYREASAGWDSSPTLAAWLTAGGQSLCDAAEARLGLAAGR